MKVSVTVAVTVAVSVTKAVVGGTEGSQNNNALEVSWPRLGVTVVNLCYCRDLFPQTTYDMMPVWFVIWCKEAAEQG